MIRRLVLALLVVMVGVALGVTSWLRMPLLPPVGPEVATRALEYARARLERRQATFEDATPQPGLPVIVSLFEGGERVARGIGHGPTFAAALRDAVAQMRVDRRQLELGRLKLDRVIGTGALSKTIAPLLALGTVPARDGVGAEAGDAQAYLTVDDLLRQGSWGRYMPAPSLEFAFGLDPARTLRALAALLDTKVTRLFRFRAEEYVESSPAPGAPRRVLPVECGRTPAPPLTRETLLAAARAAGDYLLAHLDDDGQFDYEYYTVENTRVKGETYSLPRHAGAASFLAALYGFQPNPSYRDAAADAIAFLARQRPQGCDGERICVGSRAETQVDLGASALSLVAALEYARTTGDRRFASFEHGLTEFILSMQKPDGELCHLFDAATGRRDEKTQLLYYSGEAAYALGLELALRGADARIQAALDRVLQYLTVTQYANLAGQFYIGEDHWTCMAVDAGWDFLPPAHREGYGRFCDAFSSFMRRTQFRKGDSLVTAQPQLEGAFGVAAVMAPHNTPVGSRSESTVSVWRLAKKRGLADTDPRVVDPRDQVLDSMRLLLAHQIRPDGAYLMTDPYAAQGGFLMSDTERHIRIDFIQHAGSSMLRAIGML